MFTLNLTSARILCPMGLCHRSPTRCSLREEAGKTHRHMGVGTDVTNEPVQALRLRCGTRHAFDDGKEGATVAVGYKNIHLAHRKPSVA